MWTVFFIWLMAALSIAHAQDSLTNQAPPLTSPNPSGPAEYKKMSLQELMDLDVTSVAKEHLNPYGQSAGGH